MSRPTIYIAITNHGFGHATRTASVAATIQKLFPEVLLILVTTAPRWLLECYIEGDFIHRPRAYDLGVVQADSLTMDKNATREKLLEIRRNQEKIIATEVDYIFQNQVDLILADIPFLAAPIAKAAGIPGWMMSNFGWDLIYRDWGGDFVELADWIGECYQKCDRLLRLPFHEPMSAFPHILDVGLIGGFPKYALTQLREDFQIKTPQEKTAMLTFGGLGLQAIPYQNLERFPDWQFITFDSSAPDLGNITKITDKKYRPVDLMPLCDRVISKPGFGTFSEATKLGIPIVSLTRDDFAEAAFLLDGIRNHTHHRILAPEEFFTGNWDFIRQPMNSPQVVGQQMRTDGNDAIAQMVIDYLTANS